MSDFESSLAADPARSAKLRKHQEELQSIDKAIAELLGEEVEKVEDEWGWVTASGERYSPTSDSSIALELVVRFGLDLVVARHLRRGVVPIWQGQTRASRRNVIKGR